MFLTHQIVQHSKTIGELIRDALKIHTTPDITRMADGQNSYTFRVCTKRGNTLYIKFPKNKVQWQKIKKEQAVTVRLRQLGIEFVPHMTLGRCHRLWKMNFSQPLPFGVSQALPGVTARHAGSMNDKEWHVYIEGLAQMMVRLHQIPVCAFDDITIPHYRDDMWTFILQRYKEAALFTPRQKNSLLNSVCQYAFGSDQKNVLCHFDWRTSNVCVCPDTKKPIGLLDFSEVIKAPRRLDINSVFMDRDRNRTLEQCYQNLKKRPHLLDEGRCINHRDFCQKLDLVDRCIATHLMDARAR